MTELELTYDEITEEELLETDFLEELALQIFNHSEPHLVEEFL